MAIVDPPMPIDAVVLATDLTSELQAFIDQEQSKQAALYTQRDALKAQILSLNLQLNDLNATIATGESDALKKARAKKRALEMIESGQGGPMLRGLGL